MAIERVTANSEPHALTLSDRRIGVPAGARLLPVALALAALGLAGLALAGPPMSIAADPTAGPAATQRPPTCAERFPDQGPAGVDLRLGCIVGEVVGLYRPGHAAVPAPLSSYALLVGFLVVGALFVVWLVSRLVARRAGRRLAPVLANAWWVCGSCKSVNGAGVTRCYSCASPPPDGPTMTTDDNPSIPQSFGSTRKRG